MSVTVRIPAPLRSLAGGQRAVAVEATTVAEALRALDQAHTGIIDRICEPDGRPRSFLHLFVGDEDIDQREGLATLLRDGDVIMIVPAESGGA